jgi:hypothetical protein
MGFFDTFGRVGLGVGTFGTSELANEATGGGFYGPGSTYLSNSNPAALPYYRDPNRPGYLNGYNPSTDSLGNYATGLASTVNPNTRGIESYRAEALRGGQSPWAGLAMAQLAGDETRQVNNLSGQAAGQAAAARSQLAMRGGLSGGAAERLATNANRNYMTSAQNIGAEALDNRNKIAVQDEGNRIKMLSALPGMELDQIKPQQWAADMRFRGAGQDVSNKINEAQSQNLFNMQQYQEMMRQNAANRNADAMLANAPKDRGFFGNILGGIFG